MLGNIVGDGGLGVQGQGSGNNDSGERVLRFQFTGDASEYFRIWIVNIALSIVTLGIYSAWAKVRTKKYLYRHTLLDGSSFDYLADPLKVMKGRLIVGGFILLMFGAQQVSPGLYIGLSVLLVVLMPAIFALSTAFNARNSSYRNVRFAFQGNIGESYATFIAGLLTYILTLGIGFPSLQCRVTKFFVGRHVYGLERFDFHATPSDYYRVYLRAMLGAIGLGVGAALVAYVSAKSGASEDLLGGVFAVAFLPGYLLMFSYIRVAIANLVLSSTTIGPHRLESTQRTGDLARLYVVNSLAIAVSLGLLIPWAKVRLMQYRAEHLVLHARGSLVTQNNELAQVAGPLGDAAEDLGGIDFDLGF